MKKIMACALVFLMIFGTCATSYASVDLADVKAFVEGAKTKVNAIVETVRNEGKEAAYNQVKDELINAGVDAGKIGELESVATQVKDWYEANSAVIEDVKEAVKEAYKPEVDAKVEEAKNWYEANKDKIDVDFDSLVESVKGLSEKDAEEIFAALEEIKAGVELEVAKLGHKHFEADEDSNYVAIGSAEKDAEAVAKELGISDVTVLTTVKGNEADVKEADLITYQLDVTDVVNKVAEEPNWGKYFGTDLMATIWEKAEDVYNANWKEELQKVEPYVVEVKAAVLAEVADKFDAEHPEYKKAVEDAIDEAIAFCMHYVVEAVDYAQANKGVVADYIANNGDIIDYAEKVAYAVVSYAIDTYKEIDAIKTLNPDATLVVVAMSNPYEGEYFEYAVKAANACYLALAAVKDYVFAEDIVKALTCDWEYESNGKSGHTATCVLCGTEVVESHTFVNKVCTLCGYEKTSGGSSSSGGGSLTLTYKVTFETNGGSKVGAVSVKKNELLTKPADPEKEGFKFGGWYTDEALTAKYDFNTPVTKSFTLYAKWLSEKVTKFTDLDENAWYYGYVTSIIEKGYMNGVSETEFAPNANLTRAMFVTVLYRIEGEPGAAEVEAVEAEAEATETEATETEATETEVVEAEATEVENKFTDVADDQYYAAAVKWATANGIVNGVTETEFAPNAAVTREQMAAMLARYIDYKKIEVADAEVTYTDDAEISEYAKDAVKVAGSLKILIGNANGTFAPKNNATRAEVATLFVRLLGVLEK